MAGGKRKLQFDVSEINREESCATVHGVVVELSPMKKSRKSDVQYFEGKVSDGREVCRFVSFEPKLFKDMEELKKKQESVSLINCDIKMDRNGNNYEVIASRRSSVTASPHKFRVDKVEKSLLAATKPFELMKIEGMHDVIASVGNKLSVKGKILSIEESRSVRSKDRKLELQSCILGDSSGSCKLVLWEELVGRVDSNKCYMFTDVVVKEYCGRKYLSTTGASAICDADVSEVGEVCQESVVEQDDTRIQMVCSVVGVVSYTKFLSCISCGAKVEEMNNGIGDCGKCLLKQKVGRCKQSVTAKLLIESTDSKEMKTVTIFDDAFRSVCDVAEDADAVADQLLNLPPTEFIVNSQNNM